MSPADAPELHALQRWMMTAIAHPEGAVAGAASEAAQSALATSLEDQLAPSPTMSAADRVGIYARMYFDRLIKVLGKEFPGTRAALGAVLFDRIAKQFLVEHPPHHFSLNMLGDPFPGYLTHCELEDSPVALPFLFELAQLERDVRDMSRARQSPPLAPEQITELPPEAWFGASLEFIPALRLRAHRYATNAWLRASLTGEALPDLEPRDTWVAIHRTAFRTRRTDLDANEFALLEALRSGNPLGEILESLAEDPRVDPAELVGSLAGWFERWSSLGFFTRIHVAE